MYSGTFTPKNSTTARKPGNDMKKNAGLPKMGYNSAANQRDKNLTFNGQDNGSSQRNGTGMEYSYNQHSGVCNEDTGFGQPQMPNRKGNYSEVGDRTRVPPCVSGNPMTGFKNPDSINVGCGPRNAGSTRPWMPSAGQNYRGNPDQIQDRQQYNNRGNKD
jgi:hypothetical protein